MSIGLSKKTGAQELANRFDKAILALKASGEYQKLWTAISNKVLKSNNS